MVGYRTRLDTRVSAATRIEVVTEGILTRMLQNDPGLAGYGAVIFDEFHERSLHADLGLALVREAQLALREDLRILVMSATLDAEPVAALLADAEANLAFARKLAGKEGDEANDKLIGSVTKLIDLGRASQKVLETRDYLLKQTRDELAKGKAKPASSRRASDTASAAGRKIEDTLRGFQERLASVRVLDPACGSGNFLYVAIQQLLNLEKEVITFAARRDISLERFIYALGIRHVGETTAVALARGYTRGIAMRRAERRCARLLD